MRAEFRSLLIGAIVVGGLGGAGAVFIRWSDGGAEATRNAARGAAAPLQSPAESANRMSVERKALEGSKSSSFEWEAQEARRLRIQFKSAPNLAAFVQDALGSHSSIGRFYAERAYEHCRALAAIFPSDTKPAPAGKVAELEAQERRRCELLLALYPETSQFLAILTHGEKRDALSGVVRRRSGSTMGIRDERSSEARSIDLALAMQTSDPNFVADQLLSLSRAGHLVIDGKRANDIQAFDFSNAVQWIACERGAECRLFFAAACRENEMFCSSDVTFGDVLRGFFDKHSYDRIAQMKNELTKSWETGDMSAFLATEGGSPALPCCSSPRRRSACCGSGY
jgi:hypothetical protein